jgi:hypothetical protein
LPHNSLLARYRQVSASCPNAAASDERLNCFLSLLLVQIEEIRYPMDCHQPQITEVAPNDSQPQLCACDFDPDTVLRKDHQYSHLSN